MKFTIEIGESEKCLLEYQYNQLLGCYSIRINHEEVKRNSWLLNEPLKEIHDFWLGDSWQTKVRIEKDRLPLIGQISRVFINNRLIKVIKGL